MITTPQINGDRIKQYLNEGKRFDGRKPEEFRELTIETGVSKNAEGSARVKLGKTEVLVGVKMNVSEPYADSPESGNLMVTAELLPLSSARFENGPPKFPAIELGRVIDRGLRESHFIQFDKLCIKKGEKVWTLFVDIYSINDDGNLLDAAGLGALAALKSARLPKYDEENGKVLFGEFTDEKLPLSENTPLSITAHKIGDNFVVDPSREEEDFSETRVTIGSSKGIISSMQKGEAEDLEPEAFKSMLDLIEKVESDLITKLEDNLK